MALESSKAFQWSSNNQSPSETPAPLYALPVPPHKTTVSSALLDAAVFDAYGWPHDLSDDQILQKLVDLKNTADPPLNNFPI